MPFCFPEAEISYGGTYAVIITLNNELMIRQVKPIYGRLFFVKELGVYQLHEEYRYVLGRGEVYFYSQKATNPLSLAYLWELETWLHANGQPELSMSDLGTLVDKIRKVDVEKKILHRLATGDTEKQIPPLSKEELIDMIADGTIDYSARVASELTKPDTYKGLSVGAVTWLNSFFKEDIVSRFYLNLRMITDDKYKLVESPTVRNILAMQKTALKKNIALIIINNSRIVVDPSISVEMDYRKGYYVLQTADYGNFDIIEAKTRYKYGKQNIFVCMVWTGKDKRIKKVVQIQPDEGTPSNGKVEGTANTTPSAMPEAPAVVSRSKQGKRS